VSLGDFRIEIRPHGPAEQRVPCPRCGEGHGAHDDAPGVNIETGVFHCFRCGWSGRAGETRTSQPITRLDDPNIAERKRERLRRIWSQTLEVKAPKARAVRNYLESRGLGAILREYPKILRAHPALEYFEGTRELGSWPAMVALFTDRNGQPCTIHATYLRHDGCAKAPVGTPKKLLGVAVKGASRGGAIRLYAPRDGVLGVAEGIETALSLRLIQRIPTWAAACADNLASMQLPACQVLYIGVDIDASGKGNSVANALVRRVRSAQSAGKVLLVIPDGEGPRDLNDEIRRKRVS